MANADRIIELLHEAKARPAGAERARFVTEACGDDALLKEQIVSLLEADADEGKSDFLKINQILRPPILPAEKPGDWIGRYKLLEQIGEGGCGVVYMAEQLEPVRRRVALKVIKLGMDTKQVIARFEAERQALAMMDHPNIARIFDAGVTETPLPTSGHPLPSSDEGRGQGEGSPPATRHSPLVTSPGRPFFVMELVRGIKITDYCDQNNLSTNERLELFMQVCQAIQHAHQKGIIHRDIKPSNILVTQHDDVAVPKVIDFGIAKATIGQLTDKTVFTAFAQFIGTPAYMSPEQAQMSGLDVDTRADIYSLGVLLYELLTGNTPFDAKELLAAGMDEMRRKIREDEPAKPSTCLSTMQAMDLTTVARRRHVEPPRLIHLIRGDLDWLVMKCLEKDRTRRYETANGLATDLKRHLDNEPVMARPPSTAYRFQKAFRRNKLAFTATAAVGLVLVAGVMVSTWQWRRASFNARAEANQRQRAEANFQKARDAVDRMFTRVAEELNDVPHMEQIRRELLEDALEFYQDFLKQKGDDAAVRHGAALTYLRVGKIYDMLGQYDKSLEPLEQAITILADLAKLQPTEARYREEMAEAHDRMAYANHSTGRFSAAIAHRRKALALCEELQREFPTAPGYLRQAANAKVNLGNALRLGDRTKVSVDEFRQALKLCAKHRADFPDVPEDRVLLAHIHHWLGASLKDIGQLEEAERQYRESHALREQLVAEQPQNARLKHSLGHVKQYLAELLMNTGRLRETEELLRQAVEIDEKLLDDFPGAEDYRRVAGWDYELLGSVLSAMRRTREAEAALRHSLAIREKLVADLPGLQSKHMDLATVRYNLGLLLESVGRTEEAAELFREAISTFEKLTAADPEVPLYQNKLGWMLATCPAVQCRDPERAVKLAKQALKYEPEAVKHWRLLGIAQYRAGDPTAAIASLHKTMELANGGGAQQLLFLAMAHWQKGNRQEARQWYDKAVAWIDKNHPADEVYDRFRAEAAEVLGKPEAK